MLVIRLQRTGRRNVPTYRLAVAEKRAAVKGKVKEYIGHYLPTRNPRVFEFKRERVEHWIGRGAQPSNTAARLLTRLGVEGLGKFIRPYTKRRKKGDTGQDAGEARVTVETPERASPENASPEKASPEMTPQAKVEETEKEV